MQNYELKPKGSQASKVRPWWKDVVCYQIWPRSFKDSNNDGMGDIQGIISKLDYLKYLGIDVIWISPMYKSPNKDWGYDVSNWQDINPEFGTLEDMDELIKEVHDRDMGILMDLIVTHTSNEHPWFLESECSKDNPKHDWYVWRDSRSGLTACNAVNRARHATAEPTNWRSAFGGSAWTKAEARRQFYLHLFLEEQPDLNWENPTMRQAVYEAAVGFWLDRGIDGFRIDTVNRLSKDLKFPDAPIVVEGQWQPGSKFYINGPKSHFFLKDMRRYMTDKTQGKDLLLVGELPGTEYDEVLQYTNPSGDELNMVFDFDMVKLGGHDNPDEFKYHQVKNLRDGHELFTLPLFKARLGKVQRMIAEGAWGTVFMEKHDSPKRNPNPRYYQRAAKLLCILQTTLSGTQFIFQGQEIGMQNMHPSSSYHDFRDPVSHTYMEEERDKALQKGDSSAASQAWEVARQGNLKFARDNSRTPMQWTSGRNAGFCDDNVEAWMGVNPNCAQINVAQQQTDLNSIWHFWREQIARRKAFRGVFMHGAYRCFDEANKKTYTYTKTAENGKLALVCLNFSSEAQPMLIPEGMEVIEMLVGNVRWSKQLRSDLRAWEGRVVWAVLKKDTPKKAMGFAKRWTSV